VGTTTKDHDHFVRSESGCAHWWNEGDRGFMAQWVTLLGPSDTTHALHITEAKQ
jgi:hypothetical protein